MFDFVTNGDSGLLVFREKSVATLAAKVLDAAQEWYEADIDRIPLRMKELRDAAHAYAEEALSESLNGEDGEQ